MKGAAGEIVQVEGGHIIRSTTNKKDRHSKVYTSKGPRDRRVRLAAHTAIQFYDVQDRLGYDRPSKAVDWLIDKAQNAIHNLINSHPINSSSFVPLQSADNFLKPLMFHPGGDNSGEQVGLSLQELGFESTNPNPNPNPWSSTTNGEYHDQQHFEEAGLIRITNNYIWR